MPADGASGGPGIAAPGIDGPTTLFGGPMMAPVFGPRTVGLAYGSKGWICCPNVAPGTVGAELALGTGTHGVVPAAAGGSCGCPNVVGGMVVGGKFEGGAPGTGTWDIVGN